MKGAERVVQRSVLDRLIQSGEPEPRTASESMRALKAAVLRDIEWLLNTRRIAEPAPSHYTELYDSVYHYGLPNITSVSADSKAIRRDLLRQVEDSIARFERRLEAVRVSESESDGNTRHIRFHIEAVLRAGSEAEPVFFDAVLDPGSGRFNVPKAG